MDDPSAMFGLKKKKKKPKASAETEEAEEAPADEADDVEDALNLGLKKKKKKKKDVGADEGVRVYTESYSHRSHSALFCPS